MSVPTIFAAVSGKTSSITSAKNVPLPTDVRPTTKPPASTEQRRAITWSAPAEEERRVVGLHAAVDERLRRKPRPPRTSAAPITFAEIESTPSP